MIVNMADGERTEKLAAARKKLKAFQEKSIKSTGPASTKANDKSKVRTPNSECLPNKQAERLPTKENSQVDVNDKRQGPGSTSSISDTDTVQSTSSSENLRQITMQLNGLVSDTHDFRNGEYDTAASNFGQLEKRNQELASSNETLKLNNVQLTQQVQSYKTQLSELQNKFKRDFDDTGERYLKEQSSLREQLQVHIQTIGILVAEKTELQSSLGQCQQTAKQKAGEVEELQGRLKASRQRLSDLERELATTSVSSHKLEKNSKENSKEIDRLKMDNYKITKSNETLSQLNSELSEKLSVKLSECHSQEERIDDLQKKLAMSELRARQLSSAGGDEEISQLEAMQQEKVQLESKILEFQNTIQKLTADRDHVNDNYQLFSKQLNQQIHNLNQQIALMASDKDALKNHNSSLEERLEILQRELDRNRHSEEGNFRNEERASNLESTIGDLETRLDELQKQYQTQVADNAQLSRLVEDSELRIEQLEAQVTDTQGQQVDKEKLLETMQSDKVAASRAMVQNKELKKQLEELQNGFVKMSNDKLMLTEKAQEEQHISKELGERLSQQEEELKELRDQLHDKEHQLSMLQKNSTELTKHMYQQHQLADRMRHFEAQGQLTEMLQQELNQAQERMGALTAQNSELRTMLANQAEKLLKSNSTDGADVDRDMIRKDDMVASLSASVRQLELERNQLLRQLDEQRQQREAFKQQLQELNPVAGNGENGHSVTNGLGDLTEEMDESAVGTLTTVPAADYRSLKTTMEKLEHRFTKTMKDIAELSDEKQQLEYLVLQLQGETETIGDYIALYQTQRSVMKQQISKKDEYITLVCRDREELKEKLTKLQELVYKLLFERQQAQGKSGRHLKPPGKAKPANAETSLSLENLEWPEMLDQIDELSTRGMAASAPPSPSTEFAPGGATFPTTNGKPTEPTATNPARTARRIIDLISEIGSTNLMQKTVPDNFHPCNVCSGRLMTI